MLVHELHSDPSSCTLCQPLLIGSTPDKKYRFAALFEVLTKQVGMPTCPTSRDVITYPRVWRGLLELAWTREKMVNILNGVSPTHKQLIILYLYRVFPGWYGNDAQSCEHLQERSGRGEVRNSSFGKWLS